MFGLSGHFRNARVVENLHSGGIAEGFPILQNPDDPLVRRDLDDLRAFAVSGATRAENRIAVGQPRAGLRCRSETICFGQVTRLKLPNGFALGIHFAGEVFGFISDQRVAIFQTQCGPRFGAGVAPNMVEIFIEFDNFARPEIGNQIGSLRVVGPADPPCSHSGSQRSELSINRRQTPAEKASNSNEPLTAGGRELVARSSPSCSFYLATNIQVLTPKPKKRSLCLGRCRTFRAPPAALFSRRLQIP